MVYINNNNTIGIKLLCFMKVATKSTVNKIALFSPRCLLLKNYFKLLPIIFVHYDPAANMEEFYFSFLECSALPCGTYIA